MSTNDMDTPVQPDVDVDPALKELLAAITAENVHPEVETGVPVGEEVW